ncbi:DUF1707 domain-containing protein [Actinoplanes sp. N902-109]|uniref:DUF1707 SHOCT-like domain-containing protein n=1 Tax=Actinoplanes sp. (strain N902-109) TaxID=649831 RepID=UPI0003295DD8|nr:DUF1707 domain-containing protein [Actinoplanes sp. N902-109]AGL17778.1 hypothetical protein L083_4268 [Actinoplanes sp. N902-109]
MNQPISDHDREQIAEQLQRACGDGRLTLEEFSIRVGAAYAAETGAELEKVTQDIAPAPIVGTSQPVERVVTVFSESKRRGRWRLRGALRTFTVFGTCELDLREALTDASVVEVTGSCWFGELKVIVPEGVEVELTGHTVFAARDLALAPVPRLPGTPAVHVKVGAWFANVSVRSRRSTTELLP